MKNSNYTGTILFLAVFLFNGVAFAVPYNIDGQIDDWGVDLSAPAAFMQGYLNSHTPSGAKVKYIVEDNTSASRGWANVGPGWSNGNTYDAEAIYFDYNSTHGYIAIVTGLPYDSNPAIDPWDPGDIAIYTDSKDYGIDVNGTGLFEVSSWNPVHYSEHAIAGDWNIKDGVLIGDTQLVYSNKDVNSHYVIEASFLLADLGLSAGDILDIAWTMQCGNDYLTLSANVNAVTEPTTMLLLGAGLVVLAGLGRRKIQ